MDELNGIWRTAAITLLGMFMTLGATWYTEQDNAVTREEMERYVNENAPFRKYELLLIDRLDEIPELRKEILELRKKIDALAEQRR